MLTFSSWDLRKPISLMATQTTSFPLDHGASRLAISPVVGSIYQQFPAFYGMLPAKWQNAGRTAVTTGAVANVTSLLQAFAEESRRPKTPQRRITDPGIKKWPSTGFRLSLRMEHVGEGLHLNCTRDPQLRCVNTHGFGGIEICILVG